MRAVAALLLGAGCGSAAAVCPPDTTGSPETGCVVPVASITIDGLADDWDALPESTAPACVGCGAADVALVRGVQTPDDRIAFLLATSGPVSREPDEGYDLYLAPLAGPAFSLQVIASASDVTRWLNFTEIFGLPVELAVTPSGIELAVPRDALPFSGGVAAYGERLVLDGADWINAQVYASYAVVCWDASSPVCRGAP